MLCSRYLTAAFPIGTFLINISGSFFLGWLMETARTVPISDTTKLALAVGFTGAYTTFSTFMYESHELLGMGAGLKAMANLLGSLLVGLLAIRLGMIVAHR